MATRYYVRPGRSILAEDGSVLFASREIIDDITKVPGAMQDRLAIVLPAPMDEAKAEPVEAVLEPPSPEPQLTEPLLVPVTTPSARGVTRKKKRADPNPPDDGVDIPPQQEP